MGIFFNKKTIGEKAAQITLAEAGSKQILFQTAGNNRYLVITGDTIYVGSIGISSGSFGGKSVKRYPIDLITSVDVRQSTFIVELEILVSGSQGTSKVNASFTDRTQNENVTAFAKKRYNEVQQIADYILQLRQNLKNQAAPHQQQPANIPAQIQQLAELKQQGVISEADFEYKKAELLKRI
jgi:hypothetical protein